MTKILIKNDHSYDSVIEFLLKSSKKNFLLEGKLGAGKTTLILEFLEKISKNYKEFMSLGAMSPTFSIVNEYKVGDIMILHADFYRVSEKSFDAEEILEQIEGFEYSFIEWHTKLPSLRKNIKDAFLVKILKLENNDREVFLSNL